MNQRTESRKRLDGKVAVITGATGGIGEATSKRFLEEGASVMLVGRSAEKLKETRERLAEYQNSRSLLLMPPMRRRRRRQSRRQSKHSAAWIFCWQTPEFAPIESLTMDEFESVLRTNVIGVWLSMKYCVQPMKKRGGGSIIALSSIAGMIAAPTMAPYIASKHAVFGLVKTAALELAASNVRVNAIGPGPIDNRMIRSLESHSPADSAGGTGIYFIEHPDAAIRHERRSRHLALFLASDESSYCTGAIHMIDGGWIAA